jgi:membrane-associated phospholipid phosphatase
MKDPCARHGASVVCVCLALSIPSSAPAKSEMERAGDVLQIALPVAALGTTLSLHDTQGGRQFLESFAVNVAVTEVLKHSINEQRPENHGGLGFPSGHTATAFQAASFVHLRYGWSYGLPLYALAAFVGWSRVEGESDMHDPADIIAGAAVGIASSCLFTRHRGGSHLAAIPTAGGGSYGCCLRVAW